MKAAFNQHLGLEKRKTRGTRGRGREDPRGKKRWVPFQAHHRWERGREDGRRSESPSRTSISAKDAWSGTPPLYLREKGAGI